jgi:RES domain-containing protein
MRTQYRLCNTAYKDDLSGTGAEMYGGRWNSKGIKAIYCAEHISLALLEILVNISKDDLNPKLDFHLLEFVLQEEWISTLEPNKLKKNWSLDYEYTQYIGDQFLLSNHNLALRIPSAVVPEEYNLLVNPKHVLSSKFKPKKSRPYKLDSRLIVH